MNFFSIFVLISAIVSLVYTAPKVAKRAPVLLISLDGFRASKLDEFLANYTESTFMKKFVETGVKADYMIPTFPSLTFPNHFSIVTGLHNENHGITGNSIYDPEYNNKVNLIRDNNALDVQWWNRSEPIWLTAKKQGLKTSSFFWVGSEVWTRNPDVFLSYNDRYKFASRCDEVVNWLKKLEMDFVTLYFNEPDHTGHDSGPNSDEYHQKLLEMDNTINYLLTSLERENLLDNLNIIIVSDHGMAEMVAPEKNGTLLVGNYVNLSLIDSTKTIYGIVSNIYPKNEADTDSLIQSLSKAPNLRVYRKEETPLSFYYSKSNRIAPIVAVAEEGYTLSTQKQTLKGNHGFNNSIESMRAIFLARGPNFTPNTRINGFKNVDVYPLLCELLAIECNPNNGTISSFKNALFRNDSNHHKMNISNLFLFLLFSFLAREIFQ